MHQFTHTQTHTHVHTHLEVGFLVVAAGRTGLAVEVDLVREDVGVRKLDAVLAECGLAGVHPLQEALRVLGGEEGLGHGGKDEGVAWVHSPHGGHHFAHRAERLVGALLTDLAGGGFGLIARGQGWRCMYVYVCV